MIQPGICSGPTGSDGPTGPPGPAASEDHKVLVSVVDTTPDFLGVKVIAGANVTVTPVDLGGGDLALSIAAVVPPGSSDHKVLVDGADTTAAYLAAKLVAGTNVTLPVLNPGVNETIQVNVASAAPSGAAGGDLGGTYPNPTFAKLDALYNQLGTLITTGTTQPLSLTDASMTGLSPDGAAIGTSGTVGVIAHTFASGGAETGTGAGQGGLGSAAASGQPLNTSDFPGQHYGCLLYKSNAEQLVVADVSTQATDIDAPVYAFLDYRSDLGANAKWRLWFYYRSSITGLETPITPTVSVANVTLLIPQVLTGTDVPTAAGLGIPTASQGAPIGSAIGDIMITAAAVWQSLTNGATSIQQLETTTNKNNRFVVNFTNGVTSYVEVEVPLPDDYNGGTMTAQHYWLTSSASGNQATFITQGVVYSDSDAIDAAFGTGINVSDANNGASEVNISAISAPITFAGTPGAGKMLALRIGRDSGDTLAAVAQWLGVRLRYTRD